MTDQERLELNAQRMAFALKCLAVGGVWLVAILLAALYGSPLLSLCVWFLPPFIGAMARLAWIYVSMKYMK